MVIEAGVATWYMIAWAVRKARRAAGRLDAEVDQMIDAGLDRLHEVVTAKLAGHPVLAELVEEAQTAGDVDGISGLTRQRIELELTAAAGKDDEFGRAVTESVARLRKAQQEAGHALIDARGAALFTGDARTRADGGIAIGQAGAVNISQAATDPHQPGRDSH